jgi:hypothetical protein avisC_02045
MVTRSDKLAIIGPSLADLVLEIFCFAASPSFLGVATLVSKARQTVKDVGSSSPELARDHSDLDKRITDALVTKVKAAREQCLDRGIDTSLLAQAESAVAALISTDAEQDLVVLSAVRDPAGFEDYLRTRAAKHRQQIEEQAEPYFDALVQAAAATYVEIAPWSDSFVVVALKSLLGECSDIKEYLNASQIENRQLFSQILQILQSLTEAIETLSKPSYTERVFFGSRPDVVAENRFVKRSEQEHLNALITDPTKQRTVLVGMRGCGKTQLAASLAKQCEDTNWNRVVWINAVSRESIQSDLVELAKQLKITTNDQPTQDLIVRHCLDHLKSAPPADRLIVFDNVEDINDLRGLVPTGDGLRVVVTTTNDKGWNYHGWDAIRIGVFNRDKSIDYLLTVTESADRAAADTLADRLGDLPLALAQAAATARHKDLSLAQYLKRLKLHRKEHVIRPVPGGDYTEDVATALWIAVEDAIDGLEGGTKEMARRQLGALALLAESGVPTQWLDPMAEQRDGRELQCDDRAEDEDAHDALTELIHRSIVQQSADKATTMLHRLQAQALREFWDENEAAEAYESAAILLSKVDVDRFPRNATDSRRRETLTLIEQLRAICEQPYSHQLLEYTQILSILNHALAQAYDLELYQDAITLSGTVRLLAGRFASNTENLLTLYNNLAVVYQFAGYLDVAITLYEDNLKRSSDLHGAEHFETLYQHCNLLYAYRTAGRLDEAITQSIQLIKVGTKVLGADHRLVLTIRNNLASCYKLAGQLDRAINEYQQVLNDHVRVLGSHDPNTLATRNNLASAYQSASRLNDAINLYTEVLAIGTSVLGEYHPNTLTWRYNLAYALQIAGRIDEAIPHFAKLFAGRTRILGGEHPDTLAAGNNLALAYAIGGDFPGAIKQWEMIYADSKRVLGEAHPLTATVHENLEAAKRKLEQQENDSTSE